MRLEAATVLAEVTGESGRNALVAAATKDQNARVRARAVTSLAASKDATLATIYQQLLKDQSYGVIKAAALALGQTKSSAAFDALTTLLATRSWRDNIRLSALSGLTALGDKRSLDSAIKFAAQGNLPAVRVVATKLVGIVGKDDPRAYATVSSILEEAVSNGSSQLVSASGEALVGIADPRGLEILARLTKDGINGQYTASLVQFQERLRKAVSGIDKTRL